MLHVEIHRCSPICCVTAIDILRFGTRENAQFTNTRLGHTCASDQSTTRRGAERNGAIFVPNVVWEGDYGVERLETGDVFAINGSSVNSNAQTKGPGF